MNEKLRFFTELLKLTNLMVNDVLPDMLLHLDQENLDNLMIASEEATSSLQIFAKLCGLISRRNLSRSSASPMLEQGSLEKTVSVVGLKSSQQLQGSSEGDDKSVVTLASDLTTHTDDVWKVLLTEARTWYLTHSNEQVPRVYYCSFCNKQAKAKHIWEAHLGGKNHVKLMADVYPVMFDCRTCGLYVCGDLDLINIISASEEHNAFDTLVCENQHASSSQSATSGCSSENAPNKQKAELSDKAELPDKSEVSNRKPIISTPASSISNISVGSQNPKPTIQRALMSKVVFQNTEIHADFVNITDVVAGYIDNHEPFAIAYCRPCEVICESKKRWKEHKITSKHKGKMGSKHYNNVLCRCLQCEFVVTASFKIAINYMKYHIENCHHQSTEGIKTEEYMEVKRLELGVNIHKNQLGSKASSFKGSCETVYSVHSSATDLQAPTADLRSTSADLSCLLDSMRPSRADTPVPDASPRNQLDFVRSAGQYAQSTSVASSNRSIGPTRKTSANPYKSSSTRPPSEQVSDLDPPAQINPLPALADLEFTFLQLLFRKEESFRKDTSFALFTALCTVCNRSNFSSQKAWNRHVLTHTYSNSAKEYACLQCHTRFFGDVENINNSFINHDYHVCIDAMFSW